MKVIPELAADIEAGRLDFEELAANAFMGMGLRPSLFKGVTWAEPMKKARKMLDATRNFLLGRGFRTWDDVFATLMQVTLPAEQRQQQTAKWACRLSATASTTLTPKKSLRGFWKNTATTKRALPAVT